MDARVGSGRLKSTDENRINAFEMKALRQLLHVSWTKSKSNHWVVEKAE